jgi:Phosphofructokinase
MALTALSGRRSRLSLRSRKFLESCPAVAPSSEPPAAAILSNTRRAKIVEKSAIFPIRGLPTRASSALTPSSASATARKENRPRTFPEGDEDRWRSQDHRQRSLRDGRAFGFDTALHTVTDAIDKIHTTAASHHRVMVVEVMDRNCGWIALEAGIAGGAHIILIPEIPFTLKRVCEQIGGRENVGRRFTIVVVAEGVKLPPELKENRRASPVGNLIGNAIATGANKEVRISVLGHIQRGGSPSPFDRILATRFGVAAVDLIAGAASA